MKWIHNSTFCLIILLQLSPVYLMSQNDGLKYSIYVVTSDGDTINRRNQDDEKSGVYERNRFPNGSGFERLSTSLDACIDAGGNHTVCVDMFGDIEPVSLDAQITGEVTEPYTITWETNYDWANEFFFTASDFLDDTTSLTPNLTSEGAGIPGNNDTIVFHVILEDTNGNTCTDSVEVLFSKFNILGVSCEYTTVQGETVQIGSPVINGIPPLQYEWTPNYNISDTSSTSPTVNPDTTTTYYATITDAVGCVFSLESSCTITVLPNSNKDILNLYGVSVYPNPVGDLLHISTSNKGGRYQVLDMLGRELTQGEMSLAETQLDLSNFPKGMYILNIWLVDAGNEPLVLKFVKE